MSEVNLDTRMAILETRMETVEEKIDGRVTSEWVKDFAKPIQDSVARIENSIGVLTEKSQGLFSAHNEFLKKENERKEAEQKERTPTALVKKWGSVAAAIGAIWFLFGIGQSLLLSWMANHGVQIIR